MTDAGLTLAEFVLARIAEDEAAARAVAAEPVPGLPFSQTTSAFRAHVQRWNPARVLAECEAKRRLVERHEAYDRVYYAAVTRTMEFAGQGCGSCEKDWPCPDICDLAGIYADHPDYDEEWKPWATSG